MNEEPGSAIAKLKFVHGGTLRAQSEMFISAGVLYACRGVGVLNA